MLPFDLQFQADGTVWVADLCDQVGEVRRLCIRRRFLCRGPLYGIIEIPKKLAIFP
jgi:hypothetical protein